MAEPSTEPDAWENPQRILVILAHPDDPEFFCGASLARWSRRGHRIDYCLITNGDKGSKDRNINPEQLTAIRKDEQRKAADVIGVKTISFLGYPDGYLVADLALRKDITRVIRKLKPDILVTCDPQTLYYRDDYLNHPDHRAAGQAVLDAVFPAARDHLFFPELVNQERLEPHVVKQVWVSLTQSPNVNLDVTDFWEIKLQAIKMHRSQIEDEEALDKRVRSRIAPGSTLENPIYMEYFRRIILG